MIREFLKTSLNRALRPLGFEIRRKSPSISGGDVRDSLPEVLRQTKALGFYPGTVVDVGAAYGAFARQCFEVFPDADYLLVEPLVEYQRLLEGLAKEMSAMRCVFAAASARACETIINVHPDLLGSSLYREVEEGSNVNGVPRTVRGITIDELVKDNGAKGPFLLKVDVQGGELSVLQGADETLRNAEYVLLEVSFFKFFENGPDFCDVIAYMKAKGFVPYDLFELQYRPLDDALSQIDMAFVKEHGMFRRHHFYATPKQREEQTKRLRSRLNKFFARAR